MAAPAFRSSSSILGGNSPVAPTPAGATDKDILFLVARRDGEVSLTANTTGWTEVATAPVTLNRSRLWWYRVSGSLPTMPTLGGGTSITVQTFAFSGCLETGDPFESVGVSFNESTSTSMVGVALTATGDDRLGVQFYSARDDTATGSPGSGWTEVSEAVSATSFPGTCFAVDTLAMSTGSYGAPTRTIATSESGNLAYGLALLPVAGGGGTAYDITADPGSYTLTGGDAALSSARRLVADPGSYTLTGQTASFSYGRRLVADPGSYSLTGQDAALTSARRMVADAGSYVLTGGTATLISARRMVADGGAYTLTGGAASLTAARRLVADAGSYALTGGDASLVYAGASVQYTLNADSGAYVLTGQGAALTSARTLVAASGSYSLTGGAANLSHGRTLVADSGSYALTGGAATFRVGYSLAAEPGEYLLIGGDANFVYAPFAAPRPIFFIIG